MKHITRITVAAALLGVLAWPSPGLAEEGKSLLPGGFSANVGLFTDYTFRGISQTGELPAVQGGIDWSAETGMGGLGVYLGAWASNVDFDDGDQATVEIDWYGGLSKTVLGVDVSLGAIYYSYPGAADSLDYDYVEGNLALGYQLTERTGLGFAYNVSPDNFGDTGTAHYLQGSATYKVPVEAIDLTLDASVGRQWIADEVNFGVPDYVDWRIGATLALTPNIALSAFYTDTDVSTAECGSENCDARGQLALTAAF